MFGEERRGDEGGGLHCVIVWCWSLGCGFSVFSLGWEWIGLDWIGLARLCWGFGRGINIV